MHYWRNQKLRNQLYRVSGNNMASLEEIFEEIREIFIDPGGVWKYGYGVHRMHLASIHNLFVISGVVITVLAMLNQGSCLAKSGCLWPKGNDVTENLFGPIKELIRKNIPAT
jgi:hypothetical protein